VLAVIPYRQPAERGFAAPDDGVPLLTLAVTEQHSLTAASLLDRLPEAILREAPTHALDSARAVGAGRAERNRVASMPFAP
jgi:phenazine biosynthesis protein phzE